MYRDGRQYDHKMAVWFIEMDDSTIIKWQYDHKDGRQYDHKDGQYDYKDGRQYDYKSSVWKDRFILSWFILRHCQYLILIICERWNGKGSGRGLLEVVSQ
jgi:hypothetical protein